MSAFKEILNPVKLIKSILVGPKDQKPDPLPAPPTRSDADVQEEERKKRLQLQNMQGRSSTIKTGPDQEQEAPGLARKVLGG